MYLGLLQVPSPGGSTAQSFADSVAALHLSATQQNRQNLLREGIPDSKIIVTGNTGLDALLWAAGMPYAWSQGARAHIPADKPLVPVKAHRRENFGEPLREICFAIRELAERFAALMEHSGLGANRKSGGALND